MMGQPKRLTGVTSDYIRILLVEDYKLIRVGVRMVLEGDPALSVVGEADNGQQAIERVCDLHPDVVVLDLGLPDWHGPELIGEIRRLAPYTKILVLTAHETEQEVISALAAGAHGYCLKDVLSNRLVEVVKSVHEGAMWLDPRIAALALDYFSKNAQQHTLKKKITLSEREREVLRLIVEGMGNAEIAQALDISLHTAKSHVCRVLHKLSAADRLQAAIKAVQDSLI